MSRVAEDVRIDDAAVGELGASFRGQLVRPGDETYDAERKVWNGSIDRHPALIARCTGVADVINAVRFARSRGIVTAIRSGGHSFPGHSVCDGGMVIDLRLMNGVVADPERRTVMVQAGALLGEVDRETQVFGMAVPAGIVTHTGVAGLTLGGGIGWLQRKYGLTIDQLLSVGMVTADGEFVRASENENPDLFWGLRGGGGNFGIVTSFEFRMNPVGPMVLAGPIVWAMEDSPDVMRYYRDWADEVPDELTTIVVHRRAPALPVIPQEIHGKHVVMVISCYAGQIEDGERVVKPMKEFGTPLLDLCVPKPFVGHQAMFDPGFPHGRWYYFRSCDVAGWTDEVIDATVDKALQIKSPFSVFGTFQLGGAVSRVRPDETAFNGRDHGFTFNLNGTTPDEEGFEEERENARALWTALEPHHQGVYSNYLMEEGQDRIREAYGDAKYERLKALKAKYDPDNFFRLNQNIAP